MNLLNVTMFTVGAILVWAAIKDQDPRDIIKNTLQGKPTVGAAPENPDDDPGGFNKRIPNMGAGRGTNPSGGTAV